MALTSTTLAAAMPLNAVSFKPASSTGAAAGMGCRIDSEYMIITGVDASGFVTVRSRGNFGGAAVLHNSGASVAFFAESDMASFGPAEVIPTPNDDMDMMAYDADGAILITQRKTLVLLRKGSAAAMTLAAPSKERNGTMVTILGMTDFAHVITAALYDGTTGASTTITTAAFRGSAVTLVAIDGVWYTVSNALTVIT